jgi:hypothetical protein
MEELSRGCIVITLSSRHRPLSCVINRVMTGERASWRKQPVDAGIHRLFRALYSVIRDVIICKPFAKLTGCSLKRRSFYRIRTLIVFASTICQTPVCRRFVSAHNFQ